MLETRPVKPSKYPTYLLRFRRVSTVPCDVGNEVFEETARLFQVIHVDRDLNELQSYHNK